MHPLCALVLHAVENTEKNLDQVLWLYAICVQNIFMVLKLIAHEE